MDFTLATNTTYTYDHFKAWLMKGGNDGSYAYVTALTRLVTTQATTCRNTAFHGTSSSRGRTPPLAATSTRSISTSPLSRKGVPRCAPQRSLGFMAPLATTARLTRPSWPGGRTATPSTASVPP